MDLVDGHHCLQGCSSFLPFYGQLNLALSFCLFLLKRDCWSGHFPTVWKPIRWELLLVYFFFFNYWQGKDHLPKQQNLLYEHFTASPLWLCYLVWKHTGSKLDSAIFPLKKTETINSKEQFKIRGKKSVSVQYKLSKTFYTDISQFNTKPCQRSGATSA